MPEPIEVCVSFDTTGSMYPCLTQVRRVVQDMTRRLFSEIEGLRFGVIAHGDYCDRDNCISVHELSTDQTAICNFIRTAPATGGGDAAECYEMVLHRARSLNWTHGRSKALVLIGDDVPHPPQYRDNTLNLDWRNELRNLEEMGVRVYGVQALNRRYADRFYSEMARMTGGFHLRLNQFANVVDTILAIAYQQAGEEQLQEFENRVIEERRMDRGLDRMFNTLRGRTGASRFAPEGDLRPVPEGRFQVLTVDRECAIKDFVNENGLNFKTGRGFYELTKSVLVQGTKEIILQARESGDFFTGTRARELLDLPLEDEDVRLNPANVGDIGYIPFIQSTSHNRKLVAGTRFLYEVEDWDREADPSGPTTVWDRVSADTA